MPRNVGFGGADDDDNKKEEYEHVCNNVKKIINRLQYTQFVSFRFKG